MSTENTAAPVSPVTYRFGWQALNEMTQGARRGDVVSVGSLPHNYRTNFLLSLTAQLATLNTPVQLPGEEGKRPLILHISAEESQLPVCDILYHHLKAAAQEEPEEDDGEFSDRYMEMARMYVQNKLSVNGFTVMTMSVPADNWGTFSLVSKVLELEACGYSVHAIVADDLLQLIQPSYRLQCIGSGACSALRDLRSFCTMRSIMLLASFDLSTQAALLRRNSASVKDFLNQLVTGIDPYAEVKNLAQEVDLELFINLCLRGDKTYLGVRRGKHRTATLPEEDKRCFFLPFPEDGSPLVQDVDKARISIADMPAD